MPYTNAKSLNIVEGGDKNERITLRANKNVINHEGG